MKLKLKHPLLVASVPLIMLAACSKSPGGAAKTSTSSAAKVTTASPSSWSYSIPEEFPFLESVIESDSKEHGEFIVASDISSMSLSSDPMMSRYVCLVFRDGLRTYIVKSQKVKLAEQAKFKMEASHFTPMPISADHPYWKLKNILETPSIAASKKIASPKTTDTFGSSQDVVAMKNLPDGSIQRTKIYSMNSIRNSVKSSILNVVVRINDPLSLEVSSLLQRDCGQAIEKSLESMIEK